MKLNEAKSIFYEATGTASNINRYMLLTGIAIIWVFKCGEKNAGGIVFFGRVAMASCDVCCGPLV